MPLQAVHGVLEVVVAEVLDVLAEPDGLLGGPDAVRVEAEAIAREGRGERAVALELVLRREDSALELVARESVARLEGSRLRHQLLGGAHLAPAGARVRVAEEEVGGERHALAQPATEDLADRHAPALAEDVQAGELEGGEELRAVVVEGRRRVRDQEAHLLEARGIAADEVSLEALERGRGGLAAAAHLAEADETVVGLDLDDGADEAAPVAAVPVAQRRLERHGDRGRTDRDDAGGHAHAGVLAFLGAGPILSCGSRDALAPAGLRLCGCPLRPLVHGGGRGAAPGRGGRAPDRELAAAVA